MENRQEDEALTLDAIFPTVEDFMRGQKHEDQDYQGSKKRKVDDRFAGNLDTIYTPEWRKTVIRFAQNIPMSLLIQEFERYCYKAASNKRTCKDVCDEESKTQLIVKGKPKDGQIIHMPGDIMKNIFSRTPLFDLLAFRSVCDDWAAVYASMDFHGHVCEKTGTCIAVNNNNLDIWAFSITLKRWYEMKVPCDWDNLGMKTLGLRASCNGLFLVARSDYTLFVVNPLTAQFKSMPRIYPNGSGHDKSIRSLIVDGTAEMQVSRDNYSVFLFGNFDDQGTSYLHVARYTSATQQFSSLQWRSYNLFQRQMSTIGICL